LLYKIVMGDENLLTTREAAERLNVSMRRVRALIESGKLPSKQFGRDHLIKESDLNLVQERKPGRPKKEDSQNNDKQ
jgi:excisionase family DNA binding protein